MNSDKNLPQIEAGSEDILTLTERLDQARGLFAESCVEYRNNPSRSTKKNLYDTSVEEVLAFKDNIRYFLKSDEDRDKDKVEIISAMLEHEADIRTQLFADLIAYFETSKYYYKDPGMLDLISEQVLVQDYLEEPEELIMEIYMSHFSNDISKFIVSIEQTKKEKIKQVSSVVGKHALELARVAAAAGLAAWLVSRKYRKN